MLRAVNAWGCPFFTRLVKESCDADRWTPGVLFFRSPPGGYSSGMTARRRMTALFPIPLIRARTRVQKRETRRHAPSCCHLPYCGTLLSFSPAPVTIRDGLSDLWSPYSRAASWLHQSPCACLGLLLPPVQIGPSYKTTPRSVCGSDQHRLV
jgi:hypothetical protein